MVVAHRTAGCEFACFERRYDAAAIKGLGMSVSPELEDTLAVETCWDHRLATHGVLDTDKGVCSAQCDGRPAQEQLCAGRPGGHGIEDRESISAVAKFVGEAVSGSECTDLQRRYHEGGQRA
jgi:hypothetical protein